VDPAFFRIEPAGWDGCRITFVGQWLEAKGSHVLTEAWVRLARARPRLQLRCLGTRAARERVEASIPAELRARLTVAADVDAEAIRAGLAATDVFVLPSISEGSSLALLEAMAAGCAIVTTPVGAAPDLLRDDISALLVPPGDAAGLSVALGRVLDDPGHARRLGAAARAAARPFDWCVQEAEYVRFVERIAA
jgi:glycosyltransferase involved in cell wall biosynthesis